jgi:very-long-chain (3R)-3-hydroxyacyl-CoA dehydratase
MAFIFSFAPCRWFIIFVKTLTTVVEYQSTTEFFTSKNVYKNVQFPLKVFQSLAIIEVFHALFKLVKTNPVLSFMQTFAKLIIVWLIIDKFTAVIILFLLTKMKYEINDKEPIAIVKAENSVGVILACLAWSIGEVPRYLYYVLNILDYTPYFVTWIRFYMFKLFSKYIR